MSTVAQLNLDPTTSKNVTTWLEGNYDSTTKDEIKRLVNEGNTEELTNAFYKNLEFGTGGLRGIMGVGSNKMNKYTIGAATQGLANYLKKSFPDTQIKVAIAHDSRNNHELFTKITSDVFSANGIKVYIFKGLRPTPLLSYAIRELGCQSGVVLTASHNPKEYNGYKAYWNDGAQMIAPHDTNVIDEVNAIKDTKDIHFERVETNIEVIPDSLELSYLDKVKALSISPDSIARQSDLKIVFTPIHGTGVTVVPQLLEKFGFKNVTVLESQSKPDGNFPTVIYPNPEESEALSLAIAKAKEIDADLVLATDPDADRVGIAIKNNKNEWQLLNGNQTGALMLYYIIKARKEQNKLKPTDYIVKTIVTSNLMDTIAQKNGVECYNVLTGFKFIADIMGKNDGKKQYIFGGEESYGYLVQDFVRDKDAVSSCAFIAELVAYAKDKGTTAFDMLLSMYQEYGYYKESLISITKKGKSGAEEIKAMMNRLRENPPKTVAGSALTKMADYENSVEKDLNSGQSSKLAFPISDVLQFFTADGTKISARPSGTEPKIKFYVSVNEPMASKADYESVSQKLDKKIESVLTDLGLK